MLEHFPLDTVVTVLKDRSFDTLFRFTTKIDWHNTTKTVAYLRAPLSQAEIFYFNNDWVAATVPDEWALFIFDPIDCPVGYISNEVLPSTL